MVDINSDRLVMDISGNRPDKERKKMTANDLVRHLKLKVAAGSSGLEHRVTDGYCGDLLSDVMTNAPEGCVWLTVQGHQNIVAVAVLREMAAIIITGSRPPEEQTLLKADTEGIPILLSPESVYPLAGRLYAMGIRNQSH